MNNKLKTMKDLQPYELAVWTNKKGTDFVFYKLPRAKGHTPMIKILYSTSEVLPSRKPSYTSYDASWVCVPLGEYVEGGE